MKKPTIRTSVRDGQTIVWYVSDKGAVVAELDKDHEGRWIVRFEERVLMGSNTKADAVKWAKQVLKKSMKFQTDGSVL